MQEPGLTVNAAVKRIGPRVGVNADTLRGWVKQADIDTGRRPGKTTSEAVRLKDAWAVFATVAHNLTRWTAALGCGVTGSVVTGGDRGHGAIAGAWLRRARRALDDDPECEPHDALLLREAEALQGGGELDAALDHARDIIDGHRS